MLLLLLPLPLLLLLLLLIFSEATDSVYAGVFTHTLTRIRHSR